MAWSWSHTQEAYTNCRENILNRSREWLEVVYAEWHLRNDSLLDFDEDAYNQGLEQAAKLDSNTLAEHIYEKAEQQATCDNGGFNAWACPYGCHKVSFDKEGGHGEEG